MFKVAYSNQAVSINMCLNKLIKVSGQYTGLRRSMVVYFCQKRKSIRSEFPMTSCLGLSAIKFLFQVDVTVNNSGWKQWPLKVDIRIKIQKTDFAYFVIIIVFFNRALKKFIYNKNNYCLIIHASMKNSNKQGETKWDGE